MRKWILLTAVLAAVAAIGMGREAQAMGLQITYSVVNVGNGFTFSPNNSGPITGGTVSFFVPGATNTATFNGPASLTKFTLTGPSGFFSLLSPIAASINLTANKMTFPTVSGPFLQPGLRSVISGTGGTTAVRNLTTVRFTYQTAFTTGFATFYGSSPQLNIFQGYNQEVRTLIPEPGTGLITALGLVALATPGLRRLTRR